MELIWDRNGDAVRHAAAVTDRIRAISPPANVAAHYLTTIASVCDAAASIAIDNNAGLRDTLDDFGERKEVSLLRRAHSRGLALASDPSLEFDGGAIRLTHVLLTDPDGHGRFRNQFDTEPANYRPPHPSMIGELLNGLCDDIRGYAAVDVPAVAIAAAAHIGLMTICPFPSFNARTARLAAEMLLAVHQCGCGGVLAPLVAILDNVGQHDELLTEIRGNDYRGAIRIDAWIDAYAQWIDEAAVHTRRQIETHRRRADRWAGSVDRERKLLAIEFALDIGRIGTTDHMELASLTRGRASLDLRELANAGVFERTGQARYTRYRPTEDWLREDEEIQRGIDAAFPLPSASDQRPPSSR